MTCDERGTWPPDAESERESDDASMDEYPEARRTPILRPIGMDPVEAWDFDELGRF